jgi:hypothetical protein
MVSSEVSALPWVACSEFVPDAPIPHISIDHRLAAKDAVLYLLAKGHRRIALINSDERYLYAQRRREGYRDALRDAGIDEKADYIQIVGGIEHPLGELAARRLLALDPVPTAVFAVSDTLAIGAIKATLAAGLRVPEDFAVMGFDDVPLASIFEPSLTTIAQPRRELGNRRCASVAPHRRRDAGVDHVGSHVDRAALGLDNRRACRLIPVFRQPERRCAHGSDRGPLSPANRVGLQSEINSGTARSVSSRERESSVADSNHEGSTPAPGGSPSRSR